MMEKRGKATLEQAVSMMVAINHSSLSEVLLTLSSIMRLLTSSSLFSSQVSMAMAWAYQDCSRPLNQSKQQAEKVKELRAQVTDLEDKLRVKDEELKNNETKLVALNVKYERVQDELGLLKGELARLDADNRSLKSQLNKAKEEVGTAAAKAVSKY